MTVLDTGEVNIEPTRELLRDENSCECCHGQSSKCSSSSVGSFHEHRHTENENVNSLNGTSVNTKTIFSCLHWNVRGLFSKIDDVDFVSYICMFDFVCLVETFMEEFKYSVFSEFEIYPLPAIKLEQNKGRRSGGVLFLVKNMFVPYVKQVKVKSRTFGAVIINKVLFRCDKDILYVFSYVPPKGSPYYVHFDCGDGLSLLEEFLTECLLIHTDVYILLCGDLNSRTSNFSQQDQDITDILLFNHLSQPVSVNRTSEDSVLNDYGKLLLNVCTAFDLCILNGKCYGDLQGCYTFIADNGCSVNDYFLMSSELYELFCDSLELKVCERIESDHMPVTLSISIRNDNLANDLKTKDSNEICTFEKYVWGEGFANKYFDSISSQKFKESISAAISLIDVDINQALDAFNTGIKKAATCMKRVINVKKKLKDWFDAECHAAKKNVRKLLRKFKRTHFAEDRDRFCRARREYKHLLNRKRKQYNNILLADLVSSIKDQKQFWNNVRKIGSKRRQPINTITTETWFNHFKTLLDRDAVTDHVVQLSQVEEDLDSFNRPISKDEVILALRKIKNQKAAGPDGIIGELLKYTCENDLIISFFVAFFNSLFDRGVYPENWSESIVLPLFKKGSVNNPNNYRGISLSDISSKIYSTIINNRLQEWVEENDIIGEFQAGFRRNYSTIDHMYTLMAFIQKQFSLNRKLYVAFIDFEKAFDSINRSILWPILLKTGIRGKMYKCIMSMYASVKAKVKNGCALTNYIKCTSGVKQGDVCSPILFSLFINELTIEVIENGRHGAHFTNDALEIFILLLADDVVLMSETVIGLQTQLNSLLRAANSLQIKVNMSKSSIIVFRKGGYLGRRERWTYNGILMPVVNVYKYLGLYFSTKLSFTVGCKDIASRGKRALICIMQKLSVLENKSFGLFVKLFDSQVQPIIQYGAEIWGLYDAAMFCEHVHLFALKRFLGVSVKTPNDLVYGELDRYPIYLNSVLRCIKYWLKLTQMDNTRLPRKAYNMLYDLDARGKTNWVSKVRSKLSVLGFGIVWFQQGVGNISGFLRAFRVRLIDCRWQEWTSHIQDSNRFDLYRAFGLFHCIPTYVSLDMDRYLKRMVTMFRFGISDLFVHQYRYRNHNESDLTCPLCKSAIENEVHFVLCCPALSNLRKQLIPPKYYRQPSQFRLTLLIASTNELTVKDLAIYLYKSFKFRSIACS